MTNKTTITQAEFDKKVDDYAKQFLKEVNWLNDSEKDFIYEETKVSFKEQYDIK
jgi:hypothetical protein